MAVKGFKKWLLGEGDQVVVGEEDTYYEMDHEEASLDGVGSNKMVLLEPRAYSEAQAIADYLKKRSAVVVNLKRVTPDQAKRIVDFLTGTVYSIGGDLQKLGGGIFLVTPNNINVEGKITNEAAAKSKRGKDEVDDFNF